MKMKVGEWQDLIERGIKFREEFGGTPADWKKYREFYRGIFAEKVFPYNLTFSMVKTLLPNVYFRNPYIHITARNPKQSVEARILEQLTNSIVEDLKLKQTIKKCILHCLLYGTGFVKIGFDSEFGYSPEKEIALYDRKGRRLEYDERIDKGMPWALPVHPGQVVVPEASVDIDSIAWVAFQVNRLLEDAKKDERYSKEAREELKGNFVKGSGIGGDILKAGDRTPYCKLWEVHSLRDGKIYVFEDKGGKFLIEDHDYVQLGELPVKALVFNEDPIALWGISDVKLLYPQQLEMNEIRTLQVYHGRASQLRFLYNEGMIDEDTVSDKLLSEDPVIAVPVKGSVREAVAFVQPYPNQGLELWMRSIQGDTRELIGLSRNQQGEFDIGTRRTASEAMIVQQAAQMRLDERRDAVTDLLIGIVKKIHKLIFSYWTEQRVERVLGADGKLYWVAFTGRDLVGSYRFKIDAVSELPLTKEWRKRDAMTLYGLLKDDPLVPNQLALRRWILEHFEGALDADTLLRVEGSPEHPIRLEDYRRINATAGLQMR